MGHIKPLLPFSWGLLHFLCTCDWCFLLLSVTLCFTLVLVPSNRILYTVRMSHADTHMHTRPHAHTHTHTHKHTQAHASLSRWKQVLAREKMKRETKKEREMGRERQGQATSAPIPLPQVRGCCGFPTDVTGKHTISCDKPTHTTHFVAIMYQGSRGNQC